MRLTALFAIIGTIATFNLDTKSPYIIKSDAETGYFGYSVALHNNNEGDYLLVGAPTSTTPQQGITEGGTVYKCKLPDKMGDPTEPVVCSEKLSVLDDKGNKFVSKTDVDGFNDFSYNKTDLYDMQSEEKSHQWLGVTLHSTADSKQLVGCAHRYETRYLQMSTLLSDPPRQLTGKCVLLNQDFDFEEPVFEPCRGKESGLEQLGNCQAGTSAHILEEQLVLGAPGCSLGRGGLFLYDTARMAFDPDPVETVPRDDSESEYGKNLAYIGYSTAICDMNGDGVKEVISGGPKGKLYKGQVLIYKSDYKFSQVNPDFIPFNLTGEQMGSYYGASVLCQDLNGDGYDDLLVGAPWYTLYPEQGESKPDTGRVYFYPGAMTDEYDTLQLLTIDYDVSQLQQISGTDEGETFGYSLSTAGDVNNDGILDFLVGSPYYNDGEGKVSLFLGGSKGIEATPSQVIVPTKLGILDNLRGFGWSIAGGKDMDDNGIPDVLVGSHKSQHAVLLRGVAIIDVNVTIGTHGSETVKELDPLGEATLDVPGGRKAKGINLQACFQYVGMLRSDATAPTTVHFQLKLDSGSETFSQSRLYTNISNPSQVYTGQVDVDLKSNVKICTSAIPAYYRGAIGYSTKPVQFSMEASLKDKESFEDRAVLNQQLIHEAAFSLKIATDCPIATGVCSTDMTVEIQDVQYKRMDEIPITLGLVDEITLPVKILNKGPNTAYGSTLEVQSIPAILPYLSSDDSCNSTYNDEMEDFELYSIVCSLPDKIVADVSMTLSLDFNLTKIKTPKEFNISFVVKVLDPSVLVSGQSGVAVFDLKVVNLADVRVIGGSSPLNVAYNNKYGVANKVLGKEGSVVKHKFDISLADDSINYEVKNITVAIYWPEKFPGGAWLFPLEVVSFPSVNETDAAKVFCDHEDMIVSTWDLVKEVLSEPEQIYTNFSCKENKHLCRKITCKVDFLERGGTSFKIHLATRLQEYFLNDFDKLDVTSYAELESVEESMTLSKTYTRNSATTSLVPSVTRSQNYLWIIIGAGIAALLILAILILILWKCKFFQRAKMGNLQQEPEPPTVVGYLVSYDEDQYNYHQQDRVLLPQKM